MGVIEPVPTTRYKIEAFGIWIESRVFREPCGLVTQDIILGGVFIVLPSL
jgi:hypothetical protein